MRYWCIVIPVMRYWCIMIQVIGDGDDDDSDDSDGEIMAQINDDNTLNPNEQCDDHGSDHKGRKMC